VNLGAEPKKVLWLVGILVVGLGGVYYENRSTDTPDAPPPVRTAAPASTTRIAARETEHRRIGIQNLNKDWKPRLGPKNPEDRPDPATIDPAVHLDLLAKVQAVDAAPAGRNIFAFGAAPPPPGPVVPLPKVGKIDISKNQPPATAPPINPGPPPPPQAPPMSFKYYGYKVSKSDGHKAAFLLDGDDILIAGENDTVKNRRYRVVKIGVNSITIEDTQFKSTQTLPLQENPAA
jgi:hypothetical protein